MPLKTRKEEKSAPFLFLLVQRYDFCVGSPKRALLCRRLARLRTELFCEDAQ